MSNQYWKRALKVKKPVKKETEKKKMQMYRKQTFLAIMEQIEIHRKYAYFFNESNMKQ